MNWITQLLKITLILLIVVVSFVSYQFVWREIGGSEGLRARLIYLLSTPENLSIIEYEVSRLSYSQISGNSMAPTLLDGERYLSISPALHTPEEGDMVSFQCINKEQCFQNLPPAVQYLSDKDQDIYMVKRWVRTEEDGCMHLEGDNKENSWDTRSFGCVYPDDIKIIHTIWKNH